MRTVSAEASCLIHFCVVRCQGSRFTPTRMRYACTVLPRSGADGDAGKGLDG